MGLHTIQLSYRPSRHRMPQALKVLIAGILAWFFVAGLTYAASLL